MFLESDKSTIMNKALLVLLAAGLVGCSAQHDDIETWMTEQARTLRGKVDPLPQVRHFPPAAYVERGGSDPFQSSRIEPEKKASTGLSGPDLSRPREPLEGFPLESLRYVGLLRSGKALQALIDTGSGVYQVSVGNYMGQDHGLVTAITDTEITLKELVEDINGEWTERISPLQIQERAPQEAQKK